MKHTRILLASIILLFVSNCSNKVTPTAEVKFLSTKDGVINLRSTGYCKLTATQDDCINEAQQNAFRILFYRGIPGSQQPHPLIGIDETEKTQGEKFLKEMFSTGNYKTFIVSVAPVSTIQKQQKQKKITIDMGINLQSLRTALEKQHIKPPFGLH